MSPVEVEVETLRPTVELWADAEPALKEFRRLLVAGNEMDAARARGLVVELLTAIVDNAERRYVEVLGTAVEDIAAIRSELRLKYDALLEFFDPAKGGKPVELPPELKPKEFETLFDRLADRLDTIRKASSFDDVVDAMDDPSRLEDFTAGLEGAEEPPEVAPTLELDEPPQERVRRGDPYRTERLRYMEAKRFQPEDLRLRRHVEAVAQIWGRRNLAPEYEVVGLYRSPQYGPYLTATEAFSDLDPTFTGRGYELTIRNNQTGVAFRPDGVASFRDGYAFYERKSPLGDQPSGFYATQDGKVALINKLIENAEIARDNAPNGCGGWVYETGQPWLDASITDMIRYVRGEITIEDLDLDLEHTQQLRLPDPDLGRYLVPPGESGVR
jgi:hypothetical protein